MTERIVKAKGKVHRIILMDAMSTEESIVRSKFDEATIRELALDYKIDLETDEGWQILHNYTMWEKPELNDVEPPDLGRLGKKFPPPVPKSAKGKNKNIKVVYKTCAEAGFFLP